MKQSVAGIIRKNGKFLLGLREPGGEVGGHWEFPGGKCEKGETHIQALIREYQEEFAVTITAGAFIGKALFTSESRSFELFAYEAELDNRQQIVPSVHTQVEWFTFKELETLRLVPSDALLLPVLCAFYHYQ